MLIGVGALLPPGSTAGIVLAVSLLSAIALIAVLILLSRRRLDREIREIVRVVETMRSGASPERAEISPTSPMVHVLDAVGRLGEELHDRLQAAERSGERLRAVTDMARDTALITTDADGDVRSFSTAAVSMFDWQESEVVGRPVAVVFAENSYKDLVPKLARRSLRTEGVTNRSTMVRRDGSIFEAEVSVRMIHGSRDEPSGFLMVARDITDQVALERELRQSEQRYRGLVEGLGEGVIIVRGGRVQFVNAAAEALCREQGRRMLDLPLRDRIATRDVLLVEARLSELEAGTVEEDHLRCTLIGTDGAEIVDVVIRARRIHYEGDHASLLTLHDETAERRIQDELRINELRLDAVLEATADGILVIAQEDDGGRVHVTNAAFGTLLGMQAERLLGLSESSAVEQMRGKSRGAERVAELLEARAASTVKQNVSMDDAAAVELELTVTPLVGRSGELLGRVVVCRDVTEQFRSQQRLQEQAEQLQLGKVELEETNRELSDVNAELRRRSDELNRLNNELRTLDEMKSNLLGNVSHELQTPLVSIRGYTEMILQERLGPISSEQRKGLGLSLKNIDRLIALIDNLTAVSVKESMGEAPRLVRFELRPLIQESIDLLQERLQAKEIETVVEAADRGLEIEADRDKILQVFLNLVSNAVKFNYRGGRIAIHARRGGEGYVEVAVRDTGVGIPADSLGRVFERHFRVGAGAEEAEDGTGIGLSIVRDILRVHGCTIRAESEEGRGASFVFTLPLAGEGTPEAGPEPAESVEDASGDGPVKRLRIIRRFTAPTDAPESP